MPDAYLTFNRLCEKRDLAAYRVVAELRLIMDYLKAQEYDMISGVAEALDAYKAADRQIEEFRKLYQGETSCSHQAWALRVRRAPARIQPFNRRYYPPDRIS